MTRHVTHTTSLLPDATAAPPPIPGGGRRAGAYRDEAGRLSERIVWPFALGFFERVRMIVAWCELRDGFRHFRADRIEAMTVTASRYPRGRRALLKSWRETIGNT